MAGIDDELTKILELHAFNESHCTTSLMMSTIDHKKYELESNSNILMAKQKLKALLTTQQQELLDRVMLQAQHMDDFKDNVEAVPVSAIKKIQAELK